MNDADRTLARRGSGRDVVLEAWIGRGWLPGAALLALTAAAYLGIRHAGFIWDDEMHVTQNPVIIGPLGLKEIWTTPAARYFPLTLTTFWAEHALWGLNPWPYHAFNVFLHGVCALLLWRVLRSLSVQAAWFGAALWALHPVQVETVAWVTELKNTQSGVFFLLAVLLYVKSLTADPSEPAGRRRGRYGLMLACGGMAMASKSSTVVLPLVLALCAWWVEGGWRWRRAAGLAPLFLFSILAGALSLWTQHLEGANDSAWMRSVGERLAIAGDAVGFYLGKLLWPHPLSFIYPRWTVEARQLTAFVPTAAAAAAFAALWWARAGRARALFFAYAYFLVALLPVLGLLDQYFWRYSFVGDHFQYLASMGPLALVAAALAAGLDAFPRAAKTLAPLGGATVLLILGYLTAGQCSKYASSEALWRDTLEKNPSAWMAHNNLGAELLHRGQIAEALDHLRRSVELEPGNASAQSNLGDACYQLGRYAEAIDHDKEALRLDPKSVVTEGNLGAAFMQSGRLPEAEAELRKALADAPDYAGARVSLGTAYLQEGRFKEATEELSLAVKQDPRNETALTNMGAALVQAGRLDEARAAFERALAINPRFISAQINLGSVWMQRGRFAEAIDAYEKAAQMDPGSARIQFAIGNASFQLRRYDQAIAHYEKALELNPNFPEAAQNLDMARSRKRLADSIFYDPPPRAR